MITIDELKAKLGGMKTAVDDLRDALSIEASEKRLAELEHQMTMPGFYDDQARSLRANDHPAPTRWRKEKGQ